MTTTIKVTKTETHRFRVSVFLDILADNKLVGEAMLTRYYNEDGSRKYTHLDYIDVDEDPSGKGYVSAAIKVMRENYGHIVAAPDNADSQWLYERIGKLVIDAGCLDVGFGVYEFH